MVQFFVLLPGPIFGVRLCHLLRMETIDDTVLLLILSTLLMQVVSMMVEIEGPVRYTLGRLRRG